MTLRGATGWCGVVFLLLLGCRAAEEQEARATRIAIDRTDSGLSRWIAAGDADSVAAVFADSAWLFPLNGAPIIGRKAVRGHWANVLQWGSWRYTFTADEVVAQGSVAVERGHYSLIFTAGPGAPAGMVSTADHGHYLAYWRRGEDGRWLITWTAPVSEVPPMIKVDP